MQITPSSKEQYIGKAYTCMIHVPARTTSHPSESHGKACKMRKTRGTWKLTGLTCTIAETPTKYSSFLVCVQCRRDYYCSSNNFYMDDLISFSPLASLPRFPQPIVRRAGSQSNFHRRFVSRWKLFPPPGSSYDPAMITTTVFTLGSMAGSSNDPMVKIIVIAVFSCHYASPAFELAVKCCHHWFWTNWRWKTCWENEICSSIHILISQ